MFPIVAVPTMVVVVVVLVALVEISLSAVVDYPVRIKKGAVVDSNRPAAMADRPIKVGMEITIAIHHHHQEGDWDPGELQVLHMPIAEAMVDLHHLDLHIPTIIIIKEGMEITTVVGGMQQIHRRIRGIIVARVVGGEVSRVGDGVPRLVQR